MLVCPFDAHWCNLSACRAGACELTGAQPLTACIECGAVIETLPSLALCVQCMVVELSVVEKGA